jgi:3-oxoacyl-[acyl-carrier protein] reductase
VTVPSMHLTFTGDTAVVTGGRSGIGSATVAYLASAGLRVISLDISDPVSGEGEMPNVEQVVADVTDEAAVSAALDRVIGSRGMAYLVNCAGIHRQAALEDLSIDDWRVMLDINLIGAAITAKVALPWLQRSPGAGIVNVTSIEATRVVALINPEPVAHYAAAKAGLAMLTASMARDFGRFGVRVNAVAPGFIQTPMAHANHAGAAQLSPPAAARVPMGRYGQPSEVAAAIAFLLSDGASYMTGSSLLIDGGFSTT